MAARSGSGGTGDGTGRGLRAVALGLLVVGATAMLRKRDSGRPQSVGRAPAPIPVPVPPAAAVTAEPVPAVPAALAQKLPPAADQDHMPGPTTPETVATIPDEAPEPRERSRAGRVAKILAGALVIAFFASLPWLVPAVSDALDDGKAGPDVAGPVKPEPSGFPGPVGVARSGGALDGVRLAAAGVPAAVSLSPTVSNVKVVAVAGTFADLEPPRNSSVVGWWADSADPGALFGSAVLLARASPSGTGMAREIRALVPGDPVRVRTAAGSISYRVLRIDSLSFRDYTDLAPQILQPGGTGRLVLVAYGNEATAVSGPRRVVYAEPVGDVPNSGTPVS